MGTVSDRRWPVAPLVKELAVTTPGELAAACGVDDRAAELAMQYGLTLTQLDEWCVKAEISPAEVWPEFAAPSARQAMASKSKPGPLPAVAVLVPAAAPELPNGMVFEDPPPAVRGRRSNIADRCAALKEYPGRWARVGSWEKAAAAQAAATVLRKAGFETRSMRSEDGTSSLLYACWPEAAAARKAG